MPAYTPNDPSYPQYPAPVHPTTTRDDDTKAPYDDLIDQYAAPYGNQASRTYAVDPTSMSRDGRQPSVPLSKHSFSTSKDFKSLDGHSQAHPDWEYPPQSTAEIEEKEKKTWRSVRSLPISRRHSRKPNAALL